MDRHVANFWQHVGEILADTSTNDEHKRSEIRTSLDDLDPARVQAAREQYRLIGLAFESDQERTEREERERQAAQSRS